ncbi:MAG: hypothetical protein KJZ86_13385 [Caldilineaceae bacterium]|nr:hypothetical protein [Caldilineaceae bacterium]
MKNLSPRHPLPGRLLAFLLPIFFAFALLFWLESHTGAAQTPTNSAALDFAMRGDVAQRQLLIRGRVVLEKVGIHLGRPTVSPDGRTLAVSVTPTGSETDGYAQVYLFALADGRLLAQIPGHSPLWQTDSRGLAVEGRQGRLLYDAASGRTIGEPLAMEAQSTIPALPIDPESAPAYPQYIRVAHHPENTCRTVAAWQVDLVPFEEYVARSVPAEVPVSWAMDALAAQAVAARTYAWYQIRQNRPNYDVTDWANFQMMCDQRYAASDQAVAMTAGQYLSYQGDAANGPIIAMYSAMNSHPTLDNPAAPYLRAVPDLTGLGEARWGHGYGLSQWGAARRARAGQSYRQILGHYFTAVNLQNALDPGQPIAGLLGPTQNGYLPPGGLRWGTLAPFANLPGKLVVGSSLGLTRTLSVTATQTISYTDVITHSDGLTETVTLTQTTTITETTYETAPVSLPSRGVWQQPLELADGDRVVATLYLSEAEQESITLWVDRTPPPIPGLEAPATTDSQTVTLGTLTPAGAVLGLSNDWRWEGEHLLGTVNSASVVADSAAFGGAALEAHPGQHTPGDWYGPYTTALPPGATYRAIFRLRVGEHPARAADGVLPDRPLARLDVADKQGTVRLGLRDIWASDFAAPDRYQEIAVDFHIFEPAQGIEFRVKWYGEVALALDQVWVWQLQSGTDTQSRSWRLGPGGQPAVQAISFDAATNASAPVSATVQMVDDGPPVFGPVTGPDGWQTALPITLTTTVFDRISGLDSASATLLLGEESLPAWLENPGNPWATQRLLAVVEDGNEPVADGIYSARFRIGDQAGSAQTSPEFVVKVDRTPPEMTAGATLTNGVPISSVHGWVTGPLLVQIHAWDATSGLSGVAYVLDNRPFLIYTQPFPLTAEGWRVVRYWAQDVAGNYRYSQYFEVGIDNSPPTAWAQLLYGESGQAQATWGGSDLHAGVAGYRVEMRVEGAEWQPLLSGEGGMTTETTLAISLEEGQALEIRAQAVDRVGHPSQWAVAGLGRISQLFLPTVVGGP